MRPRDLLNVTFARPEFARRVAVSRRWDIGRCGFVRKVGLMLWVITAYVGRYGYRIAERRQCQSEMMEMLRMVLI